MGVAWHKVWRDLAHNKARTALAVLSIAVGVFALGCVFGAYNLMHARMTEDYRASRPTPVTIWGAPLDPEVRETVLREPGVADAEGQVDASIRWKLDGETDWRDGDVIARADYAAQRLRLVDLVDGNWPARRTLAAERQTSRYFNIPVGSSIIVEYGQREIHLPITGIVRDPNPDQAPPRFGGSAMFYATPEAALWLTGEDSGQMGILLTSYSQEGARVISERIWNDLRDTGVPVTGWGYRDSNEHWAQEIVDTVFIILMVLGGLSLGMSAFLIVNTVNAIIAQQVWQIGVMKVVGATVGRVVRLYLGLALIYGGLALLLALPASAVCAYQLAGWVLDQLNIVIGPFQVAPGAVALQVAVGLVIPPLAALLPVLGGARITPHRAIGTYGLGGGFGKGLLDRLIGRVHSLPRPTALSLRNTFRRKARLALTLITLALAGMVFMMVMSVEQSFDRTLDVLVRDMGYDVLMYFERSQLVERLVGVAESVPGVTSAEVWIGHGGTMLKYREEDEMGTHIGLWGVPTDSAIFHPRIVSGRGLLPGDEHAILLNNKIAVDEGIRVGDEVRFSLGGEDMTWTVVGIVLNLNYGQRDCFVPYAALAQEAGESHRAYEIMVATDRHDRASQAALLSALRETCSAQGMEVSYAETAGDVQERSRSIFEIVAYLLLAMGGLAALVGGIGLMGTMSINVVERGREIGVMRSIGATSPAVAGLFVTEGLTIGALSWLLALPLSVPSAIAFGRVVGNTLLQTDLQFSYSASGALLWLLIVVVLSALASLWPALRATRVSVREALAYE
jgi:putative ABC transport system permease protein